MDKPGCNLALTVMQRVGRSEPDIGGSAPQHLNTGSNSTGCKVRHGAFNSLSNKCSLQLLPGVSVVV